MRSHCRGITLVEIMVALSITTLVVFALTRFQSEIFIFNTILFNNLSVEEQARAIIRPLNNELHSATLSSLGEYPLREIGTSSLIFFSDSNNDGIPERIHYFVDSDGSFKKGVLVPSGTPLAYSGSENVSTVVSNIKNSTTSVFQYFDESYKETSIISSVRLIKVSLDIDTVAGDSIQNRTITTQVTLRNLVDTN